MSKQEVIGWSEGRSKAHFGDSTGVYHLIVVRDGIAHTACNPRFMTYGNVEEEPRGHKCRRCEAIAKRLSAIPVIFRKDRTGDVFALFPTDCADNTGRYCGCYQHVGQHCSADYDHCIRNSRPATPAEYADLKTELERIGYTLRVIRRASYAHHEARWQEAAALYA